jgi:hypothetical protein
MKTFKEYVKSKSGKIVDSSESPLNKKRSEPTSPLNSNAEVQKALQSDATSRKIMEKGIEHKDGDLVGARLNLNVLNNTKVPVYTLHKPTNKTGYKQGKGFYDGEAQAYHHVVTMKNAHFNVNQKAREDIASGKQNKFPMASVDGEFKKTDKPNFDGVVATFNPKRHHLFVDENGRSIRSAEDVTLHGHKAYLRGKIEYHTPETEPKKIGETPSESKLHEAFFTETAYEAYFTE